MNSDCIVRNASSTARGRGKDEIVVDQMGQIGQSERSNVGGIIEGRMVWHDGIRGAGLCVTEEIECAYLDEEAQGEDHLHLSIRRRQRSRAAGRILVVRTEKHLTVVADKEARENLLEKGDRRCKRSVQIEESIDKVF